MRNVSIAAVSLSNCRICKKVMVCKQKSFAVTHIISNNCSRSVFGHGFLFRFRRRVQIRCRNTGNKTQKHQYLGYERSKKYVVENQHNPFLNWVSKSNK